MNHGDTKARSTNLNKGRGKLNRRWFALVILPILLYCYFSVPLCLCGSASDIHHSPVDIVLLPGGRALTANHTTDTTSLVDLETGKVLSESHCGQRPSAVACSADGKR